MQNINGIISGNRFINVSNIYKENYGGAIYIKGNNFTDLFIDVNYFLNCRSVMGGAIAYYNVQPQIGDLNIFENNSALISGNDKVSYP